jgi:hypothetical protein
MDSLPLELGPIGCGWKVITATRYVINKEERSSQLLRGGNLKSRMGPIDCPATSGTIYQTALLNLLKPSGFFTYHQV